MCHGFWDTLPPCPPPTPVSRTIQIWILFFGLSEDEGKVKIKKEEVMKNKEFVMNKKFSKNKEYLKHKEYLKSKETLKNKEYWRNKDI